MTPLLATTEKLEEAMKLVIRKAVEIVSTTAGLYREMTLNALRLVPRRD
jgi:hypothetical protein